MLGIGFEKASRLDFNHMAFKNNRHELRI